MVSLGYSVGRVLVGIGLVIILIGGILILFDKLGLGRLPGDIQFTKGRFSVYFPIATSILISIILTIILNLLARWRR